MCGPGHGKFSVTSPTTLGTKPCIIHMPFLWASAKFSYDEGVIEHKLLALPAKITESPMEQVGKKKIKQKHRKGKKMGRERKVTSIPSLLSHNQYYYPFPVGIPNNSLFPIRIFSLYLLSSS